jgi:hypothetical protein
MAFLAFALSACVEDASEMTAVEGEHDTLAANENAAIGKATIAFAGADGVPSAAQETFIADLHQEAAARGIVIVDAKSARYLVQTYLDGARTDNGAQYSYVLEVFTSDHRRARRLDAAVALSNVGDDIWGQNTDKVLQELAKSGADDLFAFLSNSPEATKQKAADKASTLVSEK